MKLFEVTNGAVGESYCRRYVWAADEESAEDMIRASSWNCFKVDLVELFDSNVVGEFMTLESDSGFSMLKNYK